MAINFPTNPNNGDVHAGFTYNSTKSVWESVAPSMMPTSDTPPTSPSDGQMWFDTDGGGAFVYYEDTDSSQWVEVIGSAGADGAAGATGPAGADGSAAVYATVDDLPGTASAGDQAFVTASNRLYLWNGSGWYNIALINTTPTISGVSSSYVLASDGTATTVTITATDPEGLPITYSIASDTSGNIATVTSNNNVFTITPSTNTADAGSFSLTFRASDGVNIATAVSSFTLQFTVQNSNYTAALITSVGTNNAVNNTFVDSSTSSHTITAVGNATQTTFSPYRHGGYSTYFTGSGNYLTLPNDTSLQMGTSEFTIEFWMYCPNTTFYNSSGYYPTMLSLGQYNAGVNIRFHDSGDFFEVFINNTNYTYTTTVPENEWAHIALTRDSSNDIKFFLNGTQIGNTNTNAANIAGTTNRIGSPIHNTLETYYGYLTDLRIVKGTAVYTSNFTPPTERLTAITDTQLLACHLPYFIDGSTNGHNITINGNTKIAPVSPFEYETYSATDNGGSMYFDGSGDYITAPAASIARGTDDYTIETWIYLHSLPNTIQVWDTRTAAQPIDDFLTVQTDGSLRWRNNGIYTTPAGTVPLNTWTHITQCRNSGTVKTYVNGIEKVSHTNTANLSHGAVISLGGSTVDSGASAVGNFADFRVVLGTAVYTADFTPPTAPLTAITNTSLLVQGTNAGIIDKSQSNKLLTLTGDTKSSTTQTKYLTSSMYFDGAGDNILTDVMAAPGDFTVEMWVYFDGQIPNPANQSPTFFVWGTTTFMLYATSTTGILNMIGNGSILISSSTAMTADTWHHVAFAREGSTGRLFLNGNLEGSTTSFSTSINARAVIGSEENAAYPFKGYIEDLRITKDLARYTSSFTPPTAALQG